jgi:DNA polymerase elongation subunit (family B)
MKFFTFAKLYGDNILLRGYDDRKGGSFKDKVPYKPTLFLPSPKETGYKTLDGRNVSPVQPGGIRDCRNFIDDYSSVDGTAVYGFERYLYQFLSDEYPGEIEYDINKIKLWSLDIETASENGFPKPELAEEEVLLITLKNFKTKRLITFGAREYTPTREDVEYIHCPREYDLLSNFVAWWESVEPEVITGWNVELFDMTYLCNRIRKVLGEKQLKRLSPFGLVDSDFIETFGRRQQRYTLAGVTVLDYLDMYKKFTFTNRENYRLDTIANIELGQKKLDHSEFETFKEFYTKGWTKFVDYNLIDVDLVDRMEQKMKLIDLVLLMAYDAKCNYTDTFAQVRLWDIIIYNYLKEQNIVLPLLDRGGNKNDQYAGAYVKEPKVGAYDWVVSLDLNSLYPSLIRFLNISPETLVDVKHPNADVEGMIVKGPDLYADGLAVAANGAQYRKDKTGFMPLLVIKMYNERVTYKKAMLVQKQRLVDIESEMKRRGLI